MSFFPLIVPDPTPPCFAPTYLTLKKWDPEVLADIDAVSKEIEVLLNSTKRTSKVRGSSDSPPADFGCQRK